MTIGPFNTRLFGSLLTTIVPVKFAPGGGVKVQSAEANQRGELQAQIFTHSSQYAMSPGYARCHVRPQ